MKCRQCGKEILRKGAIFNSFCSEQCSEEWYKDDNIAVTVICVKVPRIYKELRPRLGEMIHAVKRKSYNSTGYIFERAGKKPGYNVQRHGDKLTDLERQAIARMMEED